MSDTIVALATPPGEGGISIVRLSGPDSVRIADELFQTGRSGNRETGSGGRPVSSFPSHTLVYGFLRIPLENGTVVHDEALVSVMRAPHSYTREDVVELNCHGSVRLAEEVIAAARRLGARQAERGEFTERAFLNGRLDLAQAEAVLEMIQARTRPGIEAACYQLSGGLSERVNGVSRSLSEALSRIEAGLEFEEEDLGVGDPRAEVGVVEKALADVTSLHATYRRGKLISDGATVAITGSPNVGKSSLMNAILGHERAIVSPVPGTTRDIVDGEADFDGVRVRLVDTAGLRETGDVIEREGTRRAQLAAEESDLQMLVLDASGDVPAPERIPVSRSMLVVLNKCDVADEDVVRALRDRAGDGPVFMTSAVKDEGLDALCAGIRHALTADAPEPAAGGIVLRERHAQALEECAGCLERALEEMHVQAREELVAADLRLALDAVGQITGETTPEEILRGIFDEFCIGK